MLPKRLLASSVVTLTTFDPLKFQLARNLMLVSLISTEKFSEMKDEIPQSVIDSHVKNAAKARAEKAKLENSEESKGRVKKRMRKN